MLFCTRRESKLCLTGKMEKCIIPSIDKDTHGFDGQKEHPYILKGLENTQSILCGLFIVWLPFCSVKTASHLTGGESIMEFSPQGGNGMTRTSLLPRPPSKAQRSGFARKKEEGESIMEFSPQGGNGMARTSLLPRPPSKAQRSGFARKKEEGESIMEFSPQGGNGMARTSLLPRPPSKAQRSGFARKKEEGESIMEFSPQGGNGMARTSSDAVRRMCSCLPRVIRFIIFIYSAAARNDSQHNYQRRGGVEWQSPAEVKN